MNFLSRVLDSFKGVFYFEREPVFIEIGEDSIKLVSVKTLKGRKEVSFLIKKEFSSKDDSLISEEIKQFLEPFDIAGRKVILNIPRHMATVRLLKLPSTNEEEIAKIAKIESLKRIPHADEDVISAYRIIEKFEDGYSRVLLVITQAATVKREIDILKAAGAANIEFIALGSEALFLWYLFVIEEKAGGSVLVANIDTHHMGIDIIENDKLIFTRGIPFDSVHFPVSEKIIDEIRVSMATYQKESNKTIEKVVLTGVSDKVNECGYFLEKELNVPVEIIDQMKDAPISQKAQVNSDNASFVELLALSLKLKDARINLLPEDMAKENHLKTSKSNLALALILTALILLVISGLTMKKLCDKAVYLSHIDSEIKRIEPQVAKAEKILKDMNIIREELSKKPLAIDVISELHKMSSQHISLNMIDFESEKSLTVRGSAPALNEVLKYVTVLESSPYFENVKVKYASKRKAAGSEVVDFEIICLLSKGKS